MAAHSITQDRSLRTVSSGDMGPPTFRSVYVTEDFFWVSGALYKVFAATNFVGALGIPLRGTGRAPPRGGARPRPGSNEKPGKTANHSMRCDGRPGSCQYSSEAPTAKVRVRHALGAGGGTTGGIQPIVQDIFRAVVP